MPLTFNIHQSKHAIVLFTNYDKREELDVIIVDNIDKKNTVTENWNKAKKDLLMTMARKVNEVFEDSDLNDFMTIEE